MDVDNADEFEFDDLDLVLEASGDGASPGRGKNNGENANGNCAEQQKEKARENRAVNTEQRIATNVRRVAEQHSPPQGSRGQNLQEKSGEEIPQGRGNNGGKENQGRNARENRKENAGQRKIAANVGHVPRHQPYPQGAGGQILQGFLPSGGEQGGGWNSERAEQSQYNAQGRLIDFLFQMSNPYRGGRRGSRRGHRKN